jgi:hypothetical protein
MARQGDILQIASRPAHLRRTSLIALAVGTWLTAFNHGDALLAGAWSLALGGKILLNYLTPFVVANLGLLAGTPGADSQPPQT